MKRLVAVLLVLVLVCGPALAADTAKPITKAGSKALMFDLGGLANLSANNYQGGLGFKYYISNGFAVRVALGFTMSSVTEKNPSTVTPLPATQLSESKLSSMSFTIAPGIQYDLVTTNAVVAYVGAQVSFTSSSQERTGNNAGTGVGFLKDYSYKTSSSIFGAAAFIGVEWFAWENISLAGEYRFGFSTSSGKSESSSPTASASQDAPSTTAFGINSGNGANLTLAVYF
jgi:opacity protein-like surface antigen